MMLVFHAQKKSIIDRQFGRGILKKVGPKKQDFWPKIDILKVHKRLGMILENKVVQKLKIFTKNGLLY